MSDEQKSALELEREKFEAEVAEVNKTRTGVGTRLFVGATRGKNTQNIKFENFDESKPDTLPKDLQSFVSVTQSSEEDLLRYAITGYNDAQYKLASDPIAEFINKEWDEDTQTRFRAVVRNMAAMLNKPYEDVVAMVKPGIEEAHQNAKKAAAETKAE